MSERGAEPQRRRRGDEPSAPARILRRLTTRRAALLALVVCALALSIAVPLRTYLSQRADLADLLAQQQALRQQQAQLEQENAKMSDPAEIKALARERLGYVMPGETPYSVQLPGAVPLSGGTQPDQQKQNSQSWYQNLWSTISDGSR
jgi:cell division protein FtsB